MSSPFFADNRLRGRGRGRGHGGAFFCSSSPGYAGQAPLSSRSSNLSPDRDIKEGLETKPIRMLTAPSGSLNSSSSVADLKNIEYIGSYNWTDSKEPTIIVPGSPPEWTNPRTPLVLSPDRGVSFTDQNGFRLPSCPLLPLFKAVDELEKPIDWPSVDFVTDRNGLRKLMRWIDGSASKDFRLDLELAGEKTVLINRWDKRSREEANGKTYGLEFEKATTRSAEGCAKSTGHHRIIAYDLCGLKMVVRFEVDACLPAPSSKSTPSTTSSDADLLADALAGLNILPSPSTDSNPRTTVAAKTSPTSTVKLNIERGGIEVPQDRIIELTTRSQFFIHELNWGDIFPQLYLSNTPHFFLGVHNRGRFDTIRKESMDGVELRKQKAVAEGGFRKLGEALKTIQQYVKGHGKENRLSLLCEGGMLRAYERKSSTGFLPADSGILDRFAKV